VRKYARILAVLAAGLLLRAVSAKAQEMPPSSCSPQKLDDAWWTGPMLAPSAATLPRGHFLIEPYLYDVISPRSNGAGSLTYALYGLMDRLTVGLIPTAGFNVVNHGPSSSTLELGDVAIPIQYRLTQFHPGSWVPTTSVVVQETFPTGKYDHLGNRPSDGFGSGAYSTMLALYSQTYFWLPNGRIFRTRLNLSEAFSNGVSVEDVSVYGTAAGFRGDAKPGRSFSIDASGEYSLTRRWVLALDIVYRHNGNTRVNGHNILDPQNGQSAPDITLDSGTSDSFAFAPAIEYSWRPNLGVLIGTRIISGGHNTPVTITPAVAINFVH
jgi:hypothetical protein